MKLQKFDEWYILREMGAGAGSPAVGREKIKMDATPQGAAPDGQSYGLSSVGPVSLSNKEKHPRCKKR
jgi:hypothetical protein